MNLELRMARAFLYPCRIAYTTSYFCINVNSSLFAVLIFQAGS
jgi:hypothetical protein